MPSPPRVSVVVPVRDRRTQLARCLAALARQGIEPSAMEVIVCDDGSVQGLREVVDNVPRSKLVVRLLRQEPRGPAAARNLGVRHAEAPIILFLDSDVLPGRALLRRLTIALEQHPDWVGAEPRLVPIGGRDNPLWDAPVCQTGGRYHTAAIAYRGATLRVIGGFEESFRLPACEDVELAVRALRHGPIGFVRQAVVYHPRRPVTLATRWQQCRAWRPRVCLALRHGIVEWPERPTRHPRLRTALAAVASLPLGRLRQGWNWLGRSPRVGVRACVLALFDVVCGLASLPTILLARCPQQKDHVSRQRSSGKPTVPAEP